jgi:ABC-2 type transport system ATP-binding protein
VVIYQRGRVLIDTLASDLSDKFRKFSFTACSEFADSFDEVNQLRLEKGANRSAIYGFLDEESVIGELRRRSIEAADIRSEPLSLEDTFIALTGKY